MLFLNIYVNYAYIDLDTSRSHILFFTLYAAIDYRLNTATVN